MYARVFYILHTETKKTSRQREAKEERAKKKQNIGHKLYKTCQQHNLAREERKQRQFARYAVVNKNKGAMLHLLCTG